MLMMTLSRKLLESHRAVVNGVYQARGLTPTVTTERSGFAECWIPIPTEALYEKTPGIVGMGEIGRAVAAGAEYGLFDSLFRILARHSSEFSCKAEGRMDSIQRMDDDSFAFTRT